RALQSAPARFAGVFRRRKSRLFSATLQFRTRPGDPETERLGHLFRAQERRGSLESQRSLGFAPARRLTGYFLSTPPALGLRARRLQTGGKGAGPRLRPKRFARGGIPHQASIARSWEARRSCANVFCS